MENIIEELLKIEEHAGQRLAAAETARRDASARASEHIQKLKDDLASQTHERIKKIAEESKAEVAASLEAVSSEGESRLRQLEDDFAAIREKWEDQIVQKILYSND